MTYVKANYTGGTLSVHDFHQGRSDKRETKDGKRKQRGKQVKSEGGGRSAQQLPMQSGNERGERLKTKGTRLSLI